MNTKEYLLHITSGRGPAECCWVVAKVLSKLIEELKTTGLNYEVISREKGSIADTLVSATVKIDGLFTSPFIERWQGTVLWIGQSPYRKFHKRKNWYIGVACRPVPASVQFCEKDISYQAIRSGGPGGQHVNKVSTAIRATHIPTGLSVLSSDSRSQLQNKKAATTRLKALFNQKAAELIVKEQENLWKDHNSLERGNPERTFKGKDFAEIFPELNKLKTK
jgi:peptide chain release factor